jgi:hypothetical protein
MLAILTVNYLSVCVYLVKRLFDNSVESWTGMLFFVIFLAIDAPTVGVTTVGMFWLCGWQILKYL